MVNAGWAVVKITKLFQILAVLDAYKFLKYFAVEEIISIWKISSIVCHFLFFKPNKQSKIKPNRYANGKWLREETLSTIIWEKLVHFPTESERSFTRLGEIANVSISKTYPDCPTKVNWFTSSDHTSSPKWTITGL